MGIVVRGLRGAVIAVEIGAREGIEGVMQERVEERRLEGMCGADR